MENTDSNLSLDDKLNKDQYKKWTSIRVMKKEKTGAHKNDELTRKQKKKVRMQKLRNKQYVEDIYVVPVVALEVSKTENSVGNNIIHKELIKCVPSYTPPKLSWWRWLTGLNNEKHIETPNEIYEDVCEQILKPIR